MSKIFINTSTLILTRPIIKAIQFLKKEYNIPISLQKLPKSLHQGFGHIIINKVYYNVDLTDASLPLSRLNQFKNEEFEELVNSHQPKSKHDLKYLIDNTIDPIHVTRVSIDNLEHYNIINGRHRVVFAILNNRKFIYGVII